MLGLHLWRDRRLDSLHGSRNELTGLRRLDHCRIVLGCEFVFTVKGVVTVAILRSAQLAPFLAPELAAGVRFVARVRGRRRPGHFAEL